MTRVSARRAVASAIAAFRGEVEAETLRLFRLHLQVTVRHASPLALDVAHHGGVDLAARLEELRPSPRWLASPALSDVPGAGIGIDGLMQHRATTHFIRNAYARSLTLADVARVEAPLSFDVAMGALQVSGSLGVCTLHTARSKGRLTLPDCIPETLLLGARGRRLDVVVQHPAFCGRDYFVKDVVTDPFGSGPVLLFETGLVPFEMPWRDLLQEEIAHARRSARGAEQHACRGRRRPEGV